MAAIDAASAPFTPDASADFLDPPGHVPTGRVIIFWRLFQRVFSAFLALATLRRSLRPRRTRGQ
jgi:hypothetical protein